MSTAMRRQALASSSHALRIRVAEEHQQRIADELVDRGAVLEGDRRHLGEVFVEQRRQVLRLEPLGDGGEILDVGEEDRQLLALGRDGGVLLPAEDALVDLRRQVFGDLERDRGEEIVGLRELAVHPLHQRRLPSLQEDECQARQRPRGRNRSGDI